MLIKKQEREAHYKVVEELKRQGYYAFKVSSSQGFFNVVGLNKQEILLVQIVLMSESGSTEIDPKKHIRNYYMYPEKFELIYVKGKTVQVPLVRKQRWFYKKDEFIQRVDVK